MRSKRYHPQTCSGQICCRKGAVVTEEAALLLEWYKRCGRTLPWRVRGDAHPDPYAVWVSEIMLQQTTVKSVIPYFERWMKRFPDLETLAAASVDEVLLLWQGLGYYSRAKKMHLCARLLAERYGGVFPSEREELLKLPGIGPYTASSLCAFGFNKSETVVDGNVLRVISRYYGIEKEVDTRSIFPLAAALTPENCGADYASAIMDLGALVCTPKSPRCAGCPWEAGCVAGKKGLTGTIPLLKKLQKKKKKGAVFVFTAPEERFFIRKRPGKGLLSGLWELPWSEEGEFPCKAQWEKLPHKVRHVFTHIDLELEFYRTSCLPPEELLAQGIFIPREEISRYPFSTLMKKVLKKLQGS